MILKLCVLLILQIVFANSDSNFDSALNIFKPTTTIRFEKPLQAGDVIIVKGDFSDSGTEASFDLENDYCNWPYRHLIGCIEYDLFVQFHNNKMYRRINLDGAWKHHIDTYYLRPERPKKFTYTLRVHPDHFEAELFGHKMAKLNFTVSIDNLSIFRVYGYAIINSFTIDHEDSKDLKDTVA